MTEFEFWPSRLPMSHGLSHQRSRSMTRCKEISARKSFISEYSDNSPEMRRLSNSSMTLIQCQTSAIAHELITMQPPNFHNCSLIAKKRRTPSNVAVRRPIVVLAIVCLSFLSGQSQQTAKPVLICSVGTSHLESQWNWTVQETIREFVPHTFFDNLK